jgi:pimeloyl-ACP methyl ester carboxylesterase
MIRQLPAKIKLRRHLRKTLPALAILAVGLLAIPGILVYKVTHPGAVPEPTNPSHHLLPSVNVFIPSEKNEIPAWWIPGLKGAPGIILAPGYGMSRSDGLSLATVLHEAGFNVLIYDQRGTGIAPRGASSLGLYEANDMLQAVRFMQSRPENDREKIGIWGVDVGARSAFKAAAAVPEIRVIVVDGIFDTPADFLDSRIEEDFGLNFWIVKIACRQAFRLAHLVGPSINEKISRQALSDRAILFIKGDNRKKLGLATTAFFGEIQPQKELISLKNARVHAMSGEDLRRYDRQVAGFFSHSLQ